MSFRRSLLMSAAAAVMLSGTAFAADLPSRTQAPQSPYLAPAPVFTWAGLYAGVNAGAAFGSGNNGGVTPYGFTSPASGTAYVSSDNSDTRFAGGGQVGYNWQSGAFVYGLEADFDYLGTSNHSAVVPAAYPAFVAITGKNDNFLGTVRGRLGYAADHALFYVTGGLAYGANEGGSLTYYPTSTGLPYTRSGDNSNVGFALGGGVEYALTQNWTARIEYLYVDRGDKNTTYSATTGAPVGSYFVAKTHDQDNILRVGLNYKF